MRLERDGNALVVRVTPTPLQRLAAHRAAQLLASRLSIFAGRLYDSLALDIAEADAWARNACAVAMKAKGYATEDEAAEALLRVTEEMLRQP